MPAQVLTVTVLGDPISKSNATQVRWSRKLKRCEVFIPDKFMEYEQTIAEAARAYMLSANKTPFLVGPVAIRITYFLGTNRKKDLLNLPKTTCDALNDIFYKDDCQIVEATCVKRYDKANPRVVIDVFRPKDWKKKAEDDYWSLPSAHK